MKQIGAAIMMALSLSWLPLDATTPAIPWYTPPPSGTDPMYDAATVEKLKILHADFRWDNEAVDAALKDCTSQSKKLDPAHVGIQFSLKVPSSQKVHIIIEDTSFFNALGYIVVQTHLEMKVYKNKVVFVPTVSN